MNYNSDLHSLMGPPSHQSMGMGMVVPQNESVREIDRSEIKPGHIIKVLNDTDMSHLGAVVDNKPGELLYFKTVDDKYPVFNRIQDSVPIERLGNINNDKFNNLKKALLRYYWKNQHNVKNKTILQPLLNYAFIDGVPICSLGDDDEADSLIRQNSTNNIRLGNRIKVTMKPDSTLAFLNNDIVDVVDTFGKGIRVLKRGRNDNENKYYTFFYKNPHITNQFSGIQNLEMVDEYANNHLDSNIIGQLSSINNRDNDLECPDHETEMVKDGQIYMVNPMNLHVRGVHNNLPGVYDIERDQIHLLDSVDDLSSDGLSHDNVAKLLQSGGNQFAGDEDDDTFLVDNNKKEAQHTDPEKEVLVDEDIALPEKNIETLNEDIDMQSKVEQLGGVRGEDENNKDENNEDENNEDENNEDENNEDENNEEEVRRNKEKQEYDDDDEIDNRENENKSELNENETDEQGGGAKNEDDDDKEKSQLKDKMDNSSQKFDDLALEIHDIPIEIGKDVFYKVKRVPIPEDKKEYRESLQRAEIFKLLVDDIPKAARKPFVIRQLNKITNRILNHKNKYTHETEKKVITLGDNYRPLLEAYNKNDYRSSFLVPVVLDKKKIFLDEDTDINLYDESSTYLVRDLIEEMHELNQVILSDNYKNQLIVLDSMERNLINKTQPYVYNDSNVYITDDINRVADGVDRSELVLDNYDTLVFRACFKPYVCNNYGHVKSDIDTHIILSPYIRYTRHNKTGQSEEENTETELTTKPYSRFTEISPGQRMNIVGFVSLPSEFDRYKSFANPTHLDTHAPYKVQLMYNLYHKYVEEGKVEYVEVSDKTQPVNVLEAKRKNKIVYYLFKQNNNWSKYDYLTHLIPTTKQIFEHEKKLLPLVHNFSHVQDILYKYNSDFNSKLIYNDFRDVLKHLNRNNKELTDKWSDLYNEYNKNKDKYLKNEQDKVDMSEMIITDKIIDALKPYYGEYPYIGESVDGNIMRMVWAMSHADNGMLTFMMLLQNSFKELDSRLIVSQLMKELRDVNAIRLEAKDKFESDQDIHSYFTKTQIDRDSQVPIQGGGGKKLHPGKCFNEADEELQLTIVKTYDNEEELKADNYKKVTGDSGALVKKEQFCVLGENVYKRSVDDTGEYWKPQEYKYYHVNEKGEIKKKREQVSSATLIDHNIRSTGNIMNPLNNNTCAPSSDTGPILPRRLVRLYKNYINCNQIMTTIQTEIKFWKKMPSFIRELESDIKHYKRICILRNNRIQHRRNNKKEEHRRIEEEVKKFKPEIKDCIHFQATEYVYSLPNITESQKYILIDSVIRKFILIEDEDNRIDVIHDEPEQNWSHCNICQQRLYCNHYLYALNIANDNDNINLAKVKDIFGEEADGAFYCHICGEHITSTDALAIEKFVRVHGKGNQRMVARAVLDEDNDKLDVDIVEDFLDKIDDIDNSLVKSDMKFFLSIFQKLTDLMNIELSHEHETEIINYIQSNPFVGREFLMETIKRTGKIQNARQLQVYTERQYKRNVVYDIAVRLFFIIQTSEIEYAISNQDCIGRLDGYPLIENQSDIGGIKYLACIVDRLKFFGDWKFMEGNQNIEKLLFDRIKKSYVEDEYIKNKYIHFVQNKGRIIIHTDNFRKHVTNKWNQFLPNLELEQVDWKPTVNFNKSLTKNITGSNIHNFHNTVNSNGVWLASKFIETLTENIDKAEPSFRLNLQPLWNSCCMDNLTSEYTYYSSYKGLDDYVAKLREIDNVNKYIYKHIQTPIVAVTVQPVTLSKDKVKSLILAKQSEQEGGSLNAFDQSGGKEYELSDKLHYLPFDAEGFSIDHNMSMDTQIGLLENYVDDGPFIGHKRTFNEYNVCIVTGKTRNEILERKMAEKEILGLLQKIRSVQNISMTLDVTPDIKNTDNIKERINAFIGKNNELRNDIFVKKFLAGLYKSWDENKSKQAIYQHWVLLNNQISAEIDYITDNLHHMTRDNRIKNLLEDMGVYTKIYKERFDKVGRENAYSERLKTKEANIKRYINSYFRTVISRVKNQHIEGIEEMGDQWKFLLKYKGNSRLFTKIYKKYVGHIQDIDNIFGIKNTYFSYEESSSLLHYVFVKAISSIFSIHSDNKLARGVMKEESDELGESVTSEISSSSVESSSTNYIKGIRFKQTEESKNIVEFIYGVLNKIKDDQNLFNELTQQQIHKTVEWERRKSLKQHLKLFQVMEEAGKREEKLIAQAKIKINGRHRLEFEKLYGLYTGEESDEQGPKAQGNLDQHQIEDQAREQQLEQESKLEEGGYVAGEGDDVDDYDPY